MGQLRATFSRSDDLPGATFASADLRVLLLLLLEVPQAGQRGLLALPGPPAGSSEVTVARKSRTLATRPARTSSTLQEQERQRHTVGHLDSIAAEPDA